MRKVSVMMAVLFLLSAFGCNAGVQDDVLAGSRAAENETLAAQEWQPGDGWALQWGDEFNGPSINLNNWAYDQGASGWGNNEWENYTNASANSYIENGALVIKAIKTTGGAGGYTSARLKTQGKQLFKYGKIAAKIKIPYGQGIWPAFWMLGEDIGSAGWPTCGEIDILENVGYEPNKIHGSLHGPGYSGATPITSTYQLASGAFSDAFHVYEVEWDPLMIRWFIDGTNYYTVRSTDVAKYGRWVYDHNFFIIINIAVGGGWPGYPDGTTVFPQTMTFDWIRVYQRSSLSSSSSVSKSSSSAGDGVANRLEAENYTAMAGIQTEACSEGGLDVGWIDAGDWMVYPISVGTAGTYVIEYRVASLNGGGVITPNLNANAIVLPAINVPATGGWQNWTTISQTVTLPAGNHNLGIYATAGGWNINWFQIRPLQNQSSSAPVSSAVSTASSSSQPPVSSKSSSAPVSSSSSAVSATGQVNIEMYNGGTAAVVNSLNPKFRISNSGSTSLSLANLKVRYFYTKDGSVAQSFWCDWSTVGSANVTGVFAGLSSPTALADTYLEIGFTSGAGTLAPGASIEVQTRFAKTDWSSYNQANDYSFNPNASGYVIWTKTTAYINGALAFGSEPSGTVVSSSSSAPKSSSSSQATSKSSSTASSVTGKVVPGLIEAESYDAMSGIQTEVCAEGTLDVGWIDTGDWFDYKVTVLTSGDYTLEYRTASLNATGKLDFVINGTTLSSTVIPNTGGWQNWTTVSTTVRLSAGAQTIRLYASGPGFNLNWFKLSLTTFTSSSSSSSTSSSQAGAFWDRSNIPQAKNVMIYKFINRTYGKYSDSQVFWSFNGQTHSIAEQPYVDMPANSSGRVYFYLGTPNSQYFDFIEHTIGNNVWNGNTTRVDAWGLPLALLLHCSDGYEVQLGDDLWTFQAGRETVFNTFKASVPAEFQSCATQQYPYRILAPHFSANFQSGGANANYFNGYVDQMWAAQGLTIAKPNTTQVFGCSGPLATEARISAALNRHTGHLPQSSWETKAGFYQAAPANYYSKFWHDHGINGLAYGFPYDDVGENAAFASHGGPQYLIVAIGY